MNDFTAQVRETIRAWEAWKETRATTSTEELLIMAILFRKATPETNLANALRYQMARDELAYRQTHGNRTRRYCGCGRRLDD